MKTLWSHRYSHPNCLLGFRQSNNCADSEVDHHEKLLTIILLYISIKSNTDSLDHHSRNSIMLLLYMLQTALVLIYFNLVKNLRYFIRKKCNLKGSQLEDCFESIACQPCVTIQMAHEYDIFEKKFDYDSMEAIRFKKLVSYLERKRIQETILYVWSIRWRLFIPETTLKNFNSRILLMKSTWT